jgi:hypothetical protein
MLLEEAVDGRRQVNEGAEDVTLEAPPGQNRVLRRDEMGFERADRQF